MCKNNGWIYLIVYFIMFPLGVSRSKAFRSMAE